MKSNRIICTSYVLHYTYVCVVCMCVRTCVRVCMCTCMCVLGHLTLGAVSGTGRVVQLRGIIQVTLCGLSSISAIHK